MSICIHVWGPRACFPRPEFRVERVSYDVITPSAARGILEAIHWKPAIRWQIKRIHVLRPINFEPIFAKHDRRAGIILTDVSYIIEANLSLTDRAGPEDNETKHLRMFHRRARRGQLFQPVCLGMPEFLADFTLIEEGELPQSNFPRSPDSIDLGWMLHDIDYEHGKVPRFFRAKIENGSISIPALDSRDLVS